MKIGKAHATARQLVEIRRGDFTAESTDIGKAPVISDQHHDVGPVGRCCDGRAAQTESQGHDETQAGQMPSW